MDSRTRSGTGVYSFPGLGLNEVGGRNFVKTMVEFNLPPWRFSPRWHAGKLPDWMRPAVSSAPAPTRGREFADRADAGGQLDFRFTVLSDLDMTLSVGGAVAFRKGHAPSREAMVSLKVLR